VFCCVCESFRCSKKGGKTNEKEGQHTHALLCFVCGTGLALGFKNGVSAFFVVVVVL